MQLHAALRSRLIRRNIMLEVPQSTIRSLAGNFLDGKTKAMMSSVSAIRMPVFLYVQATAARVDQPGRETNFQRDFK